MASYRFAVLGDPVSHSRSPAIHTAMLSLAGLDGNYERIRADRETLSASVVGLRAGEWHGFNVTMPLKGAAADVSDRLSPQAGRSRSVNTLLMRGDDVWGHSTDSSTFHELINGPRFREVGSILLLGAGGSAAAALTAIAGERPVYVSARRTESADRITKILGGEVVAWGAAVAGALVINTTPLGMHGENLPDDIVEVASGLIDLPYASGSTPAVDLARALKLPTVDGPEFLIRQAMASFHLWTGESIDYDDLVAAITNV